jgi:intracellular sulfur oxidation DsrE/DsrF family protein
VADGRAPQGMPAADVRNDIQANLIPNATLIPAMVGEVLRLQQNGFTLVFVPIFRP